MVDRERLGRALERVGRLLSRQVQFNDKLIAVRDRNGFRPLCYGRNRHGDYIVASESCAISAVDAEFVRDILPGEVVVFDENGTPVVTPRQTQLQLFLQGRF